MKRVFKDRALTRGRINKVAIVIIAIFFILSIRLAYIMTIKQEEYSRLAKEQWTSEVKVDARRGKILDRNGKELAVSANVYRIDFDLKAIKKYTNDKKTTMEDLAKKISEASKVDEKIVLKKLNTRLSNGAPAGSATLVRRIEKQQADAVKELKIPGILISPDTKRYYPNNTFASHLLGSTNIDGKGLTGVELQYDKYLTGVPGMKIAELDRDSRDYPYTVSKFTPPVNGADVTLTIDETIQYIAEKAAEKALNDNKAKAATVLVMNPRTGEVLAMANKSDFDPNDPFKGAEKFDGKTEYDKVQKMWRNRAVNDTFEPGSIFKPFVAAAAMEEGLVKPGETFTCTGGLNYGGRRINCWKTSGHGTITFEDTIAYSCNVGFMELGKKLGKEKLYEYTKKFGFGEKTGIDLPGEAKGIIKTPQNMTDTDVATISFGHTNTINSMQIMAGFNAIANGGKWIQPHIMKEVNREDESGTNLTLEVFKPKTKDIISEKVATELRGHLEGVVLKGSGKNIFIEGYHIGGKTGTAKKVENGVYHNKYISSFVGMAPVNDPKVTVMITVDEPGNGQYYGGVVTSPIAKSLFEDLFNYMDSDFSKENESAIMREVVIPEVRGKSLEEAKSILKEKKIEYNIEGKGDTITSVKPYPGYVIKEGTKITLYTEENGASKNAVSVPNLEGYSKESASETLSKLGLKYTFKGEGIVVSQSIPSGELVDRGKVINLELSSQYGD